MNRINYFQHIVFYMLVGVPCMEEVKAIAKEEKPVFGANKLALVLESQRAAEMKGLNLEIELLKKIIAAHKKNGV